MTFTAYDSFEEMMDDLSKAMDAADARVKPWQTAIQKGHHFWHPTDYGFPIFGQVLEDGYKEEHLKHYRFCFCFSEACPEGEKGDVHISVIGGLISKECFEAIYEKMNGRLPDVQPEDQGGSDSQTLQIGQRTQRADDKVGG